MLDPFAVIDTRTVGSKALWYVETTEICRWASDPANLNPPYVVTYPNESFTLWQAHMPTTDVAPNWMSWDVGCGDLEGTVSNYYSPYDPHDPQDKIISMGINWTDPMVAAQQYGFVYLKANWSEVEWSTDLRHRRAMLPVPPVVARLTAEATRIAGLLPQWSAQQEFAKEGEVVDLIAKYDAESPIWPKWYPDDPESNARYDKTQESHQSLSLQSSNGSGCPRFEPGCQSRSYLRGKFCAGGRAGWHIHANDTRAIE